MVPLPVPLLPAPTFNHDDALLDAVHVHPVGAAIDVDTVPPLAPTEMLTGVSAYVQGAAVWLTVNVWPPIVSVPCRVCVTAFAAAENATDPLPLPLALPLMLNQLGASLTAVHVQPAGAVMAVDPVPPPNATDALTGDSEYVQATPGWSTVNVWPPTVSVPCRA